MALVVRILAVALLGGGIVLLMLGYDAHQSTVSGIARTLTGSSTKQTVMLLTGGGALVLAGVALLGPPTGKKSSRRARR